MKSNFSPLSSICWDKCLRLTIPIPFFPLSIKEYPSFLGYKFTTSVERLSWRTIFSSRRTPWQKRYYKEKQPTWWMRNTSIYSSSSLNHQQCTLRITLLYLQGYAWIIAISTLSLAIRKIKLILNQIILGFWGQGKKRGFHSENKETCGSREETNN